MNLLKMFFRNRGKKLNILSAFLLGFAIALTFDSRIISIIIMLPTMTAIVLLQIFEYDGLENVEKKDAKGDVVSE